MFVWNETADIIGFRLSARISMNVYIWPKTGRCVGHHKQNQFIRIVWFVN